MGSADVVLLGEYHDDPVAHALQLQLLKRAIASYHEQHPPHQSLNTAAAAAPTTQQQQQHQQQQQSPQQQQQQQQQSPRPGGNGSGVAAASPAPGLVCRRPVMLSLEMFETDVQVVMDEYLAGGHPSS
jgi:hypothetical protein